MTSRMVTVDVLPTETFYGSLAEALSASAIRHDDSVAHLIEVLQQLEADTAPEHRNALRIEIDAEETGTPTVRVWYERPETLAERQVREGLEAAGAEATRLVAENRDRQEYERLRAKYGEPDGSGR